MIIQIYKHLHLGLINIVSNYWWIETVYVSFVYSPAYVVIRMHISEMTIGSFPQITAGSYSALIHSARSSYESDCLTTSKLLSK